MCKPYQQKYTLLTAAALMLTGCGASPLDDSEGGLSDVDQMEVPVVMSVAPTFDENSSDIYDHGTLPADELLKAESAINPVSLYIATYTAKDAKFIEAIYWGGVAQTATKTVFYDSSVWGPTCAFVLNKDAANGGHAEYNEDFYIVAYALPKTMGPGGNASLGMPTVGTQLSTTMGPKLMLANNLYGTETAPKTWTLADYKSLTSDGSDVLLPMAGCMRITKEWIEATYNRDIYGVAPLQLPAIRMTRAVAKIVIEDPYEIIGSATMHHNTQGHLIPAGLSTREANVNSVWWSQSFTDTPDYAPNATATTHGYQKLEPSNMVELTKEDGSTVKAYIFYALEHDFTDKSADSEDRALITLQPKAGTGLSADKKIYIAPYDNNGQLRTDGYDVIKAEDSGAWRGLLRNHCYTFSVSKPANGEIQIYVQATKWTHHRQNFTF